MKLELNKMFGGQYEIEYHNELQPVVQFLGDSANEDHYGKEYAEEVFENIHKLVYRFVKDLRNNPLVSVTEMSYEEIIKQLAK